MLTPVVAEGVVGDIIVLVEEALAEVAAMPAEKAREIIVQLGGVVRGSTTPGGEPTVIRATAAGEGRQDGFATMTVERTATISALVAEPGSAIGRLLATPEAKALFWAVVGNAAYDGLKAAVKLGVEQVGAAIVAAHITSAPVQPSSSPNYCPPPGIEQHEPTPAQPAPPLGPFADYTKT